MYGVFLVDDEPFILEGLKSLINWKEHGFEITGQAINGVDALNQLQYAKADILITDITMPKMNGLELIGKIKQDDKKMNFIVLSGYDEFQFVKQGIALGIENYLLKPVNVQELLSTLANTSEKLESQKYMEIKEKRDTDILRENILNRWVAAKIDPMELRERSHILRISLEHTLYTACIIKIISPDCCGPSHVPDWPDSFSMVYGICCDLMGNDDSWQCFSNLDGEIVAVFGAESAEEGRMHVKRKLEEVAAGIGGMPGLETFITAGGFQNGFSNLGKSYLQAGKMQEYRLMNPHGGIYFHDEARQGRYPEPALPKAEFQRFSKLLLSRDKNAVFGFIDNIFAELRNCRGITPSQVQNCCMEIVVQINRTLENLEFSMTSGGYRELFFSMTEMGSLEQLGTFVKSIADNAINCFIKENDKVSPVIRQVLNYINNRYTEELSLKTLGYEMNINPVYLGQLFQKETGQLFNEYVNTFKMQKAKQLLLNTNLKAIEISRKVGFPDPNYFFRQFRKYVGMSPTELRSFRNAQ